MVSNLELLRQLHDLSEEDVQAITLALLNGEGEKGCTAGEVAQFVQWAEGVLVDVALVGLIIAGRVTARWSPEEDDWVFKSTEAKQ